MLKSWKLRAVVAGVALVAAPMALMGTAVAQTVPGPPTVSSLTPVNGPPGTTVTVTATNCGTTAAPATSGTFFLTGPTITAVGPPPGTPFGGTVSAGNVLTGSVTIPAAARDTDVFTVNARCNNASGQGMVSTAGLTFTTTASSILPTITTGTTGSSTTLSGVLSGQLSGGTGTSTGGFGTTSGGTTGVAQPITATPSFTG